MIPPGLTLKEFPQPLQAFACLADYLCALEAARLQALVQRDMPLAWALHAPQFQLVTPSGVTFTRERYLNRVAAGGFYLAWQPGPMAVRTGSDMAVVRYPAEITLDDGSGHGQPFKTWHTDSYEWLDGRWQVVWSQATALK